MYTSKTISSSSGAIIFLIGILCLALGAVFEYYNINISSLFQILGAMLLFIGLTVMFKSYGGNLILPQPLEEKISDAYSQGFKFYEPDNHDLERAKQYGKVLFRNYSKDFLFIHTGHLAANFYEDMLPILKESLDDEVDVRILLEKYPEDPNLSSKYIQAGIPIQSYEGITAKQLPHFFVSESSYRIEMNGNLLTSAASSEGHGSRKETRGYFVFNADKRRVTKLKAKFENIWNKSKGI
ncbi:MAG: hypothetical protein KKE12_20940 [Proteobacteria bacterium]|nr:hypothetical protein [Pseudomonadota bacterium]